MEEREVEVEMGRERRGRRWSCTSSSKFTSATNPIPFGLVSHHVHSYIIQLGYLFMAAVLFLS